MDKDFGMAGVPGLSQRDRRRAKTLRLWVRRKRGNRKLECSGCGQRIGKVAEVYQREVRDLPWSEYRTTVVIELYRVRCPDCGIKSDSLRSG